MENLPFCQQKHLLFLFINRLIFGDFFCVPKFHSSISQAWLPNVLIPQNFTESGLIMAFLKIAL